VVRMVIGADGLLPRERENQLGQTCSIRRRSKCSSAPSPWCPSRRRCSEQFILELRAIYSLMVDAMADRALIQ